MDGQRELVMDSEGSCERNGERELVMDSERSKLLKLMNLSAFGARLGHLMERLSPRRSWEDFWALL